jgi:hypothetical protein
MADKIITHITENGTVIEAGPDANEYLKRLRGAIQTKQPENIRVEVRKVRVSSQHELRRLSWAL